jgi:hypothetical protein
VSKPLAFPGKNCDHGDSTSSRFDSPSSSNSNPSSLYEPPSASDGDGLEVSGGSLLTISTALPLCRVARPRWLAWIRTAAACCATEAAAAASWQRRQNPAESACACA